MKRILAVALFSSVFATPAFAADTGFFGAIDAQNWHHSGGSGVSNPSTGLRVGGGYHFTQNFGVEVDYAQSGSGTLGGLNYKADSLQVAAVDTWHINDKFSLFSKLGLTANKLTGDATTGCSCSKTGVMIGTGGQYNINKQIGIRLETDFLGSTTTYRTGGNIAGNNISLGVVYNF